MLNYGVYLLNLFQIKLYLGNVTQLSEPDSQVLLIVTTAFVLKDFAGLVPLGV